MALFSPVGPLAYEVEAISGERASTRCVKLTPNLNAFSTDKCFEWCVYYVSCMNVSSCIYGGSIYVQGSFFS